MAKQFQVTYKCFRKNCGCVIIKTGTNRMKEHSTLVCPFCGYKALPIKVKNFELLEKYYQNKEYEKEIDENK